MDRSDIVTLPIFDLRQCYPSLFTFHALVAEYIFPRPRKVSPRDGTEVKTCFICRGKVSFSAVVEKKDSCLTERSSCLTDRSSCLPERSEGRQRREVRQRSEVRQSF